MSICRLSCSTTYIAPKAGMAVATTIILPVMASSTSAALKRWWALMPGITTPILSVSATKVVLTRKDVQKTLVLQHSVQLSSPCSEA